MSVINGETRTAWQCIADECAAQRPGAGREVLVERGKWKGHRGRVVRHLRDDYQASVWRYGGEASHHMRDMRGREGFVCIVQLESGERPWIKAQYLLCDPPEVKEVQ